MPAPDGLFLEYRTVMQPLLVYFGLCPVSQVTARCASSNQAKDTCKVLPVARAGTTVSDIPSPRDGMSYTSIHQVFKASYISQYMYRLGRGCVHS
jgi:hypothetical protein